MEGLSGGKSCGRDAEELSLVGMKAAIILGPGLAAILCVGAQANVSVKRYVDYKEITSTALLIIPDAQGLRDSGLMLTDMVRSHLEEAGLPLLDRTTQQALLKEKNIEVDIHTPREKLRAVGHDLGVDAVVIGRLNAEVEDAEVGTMSSRRKILVRRNGKFVQVWRDPDPGPGQVRYFQTDGPVSVQMTIKMIRVDTGEVLWFLAEESRKRGFQKALRSALDSPMRSVTSVIKKSLSGRTFKPKRRKKWKGLDRGWDDRHEGGRF